MRHPGQGELTYPQHGLTRALAQELVMHEPAADEPPGAAGPGGGGAAGLGGGSVAGPGGGEPRWPAGYRRAEKSITVGQGAAVYRRLADAILNWEIQRGAGFSVRVAARAAPGVRVISGFGIGDLRLPVPCEVVWAQEPTAVESGDGGHFRAQLAGFGYGTLPGHPASGEEAFIARLGEDGAVRFEVLAFSRPAGLIFRIGAPAAALSQRLVTRRYLQAAHRIAAGPARG